MNAERYDKWTSDAIERGEIAKIKQRVIDDPNYLSSRDYLGDTPLMDAISFGHMDLVGFFLTHGADPNVQVDDGFTCLLTAVSSDQPDSIKIMQLLIDAGADIHSTGTNDWTPLHMAASYGHLEKTRLLIKAGADVNRRTGIDGKETPLMEAAFSGHPEVVQLLLEHGADATMRETVGNRTPLEIARDAARGADPSVVEFLKKQDFESNVDELMGDVELTDKERAFLESTIKNLDMAQRYREDAEKLAREGNHDEVMRILSDHKAKR